MAEAGAGDLLTLWKVGRVELPKIAQVYTDAITSIGPTAESGALPVVLAGDAGDGAGLPVAAVFRAWAEVNDELLRILSVCADRAAGAGQAVGRAISEHTGTDADGTNATTAAGRQLWQLIHDPSEVDPGDPDQNPPELAGGDAADRRVALEAVPATRYLPEVTRRAEAIRNLVIERKKDDDSGFQDFVRSRFEDYANEVNASYEQWQHSYEEWWAARHAKAVPDSAPRPVVSPVQQAPSGTAELRAAYERHVEESSEWIIPAFRAWAVPDPDALSPYVNAIRAAEDRLGDGQVVRVATSAQINLASQWDGAYCTGLRNFLASFLVIAGNQQTIARTLRELLEAQQALCRQAQENMIKLAESILEAVRAAGKPEKSQAKTYLTILSAVTWIAAAALAIPSGGASIYAGVVTFNAVAAVSGAAASLLPGGDPKVLDADTVDGVLEKMSQVMTEARAQMAARQNDILAALTHNQTALAALRQASTAAAATPVTPSRPAILDAGQGEIGAHLHPK
ncbi:MAG TPA: hypothetical protein VEL03_04210 [Streptosporangiaceae bacterium]|nr:hypothetical protein [Streptosporangiaceae bacterium]